MTRRCRDGPKGVRNLFPRRSAGARSVVPVVALVLLTAGCSGARESKQSATATYSITLHESQTADGLGPPTVREVTLTATTVDDSDNS